MIAKHSNLKLVVAGLLLGILMAAMDNTIVATAMGTIVGELGGLDKFVWVTSAYMVASMAGMPIFGKLSDMYGRKQFFIFGLIVFLLGSILCGTADSIVQLSIYRAIQGIGGGALMPIAFTIIYDIFPPEQRGKMTGLFGAVFGMSSIFGPLLGAYITDYVGWHWVFYINLPIGILAFVLVVFFYHESLAHTKQKIDWWGALTLVPAVVSLMFALELGGSKYEWDSFVILGLFGAFAVLTFVFFMIEARVEEPIISFSMFKNRLFAASSVVAFLYGSTFIVATIYIPIFIQGVSGGSATNSGLILLPLMLANVVASQTGGIMAHKTTYRNIMFVSAAIFVTGMFLLSTLEPDSSRSQVTLYMIVTGLGVGSSFSVLGMAAIHHFDIRQRGMANSTFSFLRSVGMTLGITIFGILQRNAFTDNLTDLFAGMGKAPHGTFGDPRALLSPEARAGIPAPILAKITEALSSSITQTFLLAIIPAGLALLFVFTMSGESLKALKKDGRPQAEPVGSTK